MATIRDVARQANVSISTASRILSNSTSETFSEATQARVLRASLELGYRPNFAARALVSGRTHIVAAVFPRIYDTPFTALASLQILAGIEAYCSANGYHLLLSAPQITDGEIDPNFINLLAGGYLDGMIVDGHLNIDPVIAALRQFDLPVVMLGYQPHPYYLRSDNFLGGRLLMQHLLELGHRRIGIIGLPDGASLAAEQRIGGLNAAYEAWGLNPKALPHIAGTFSLESGSAAAAALLSLHPDLTALVALNDRMAMGAVRQLQAMGCQVPEQISVVGYDDLPQSSEFHPPLTTINQRLGEWGAMAMHILVAQLNGGQPEPVVLEPRLIVRESSAPSGR